MKPRLLADENTSHRLVLACRRIDVSFPIIHIADWQGGAFLSAKDPALLMTLRDCQMILVGFDRSSLPQHAGNLTREGVGHAGIILLRRSIGVTNYGQQARVLIHLWSETREWDWSDRIEYVPPSGSISIR